MEGGSYGPGMLGSYKEYHNKTADCVEQAAVFRDAGDASLEHTSAVPPASDALLHKAKHMERGFLAWFLHHLLVFHPEKLRFEKFLRRNDDLCMAECWRSRGKEVLDGKGIWQQA